MKQERIHEMVTDTDFAKVCEFRNEVSTMELLLDIKVLMKEYYAATFSDSEEALIIAFNNGQKFLLSISSYK